MPKTLIVSVLIAGMVTANTADAGVRFFLTGEPVYRVINGSMQRDDGTTFHITEPMFSNVSVTLDGCTLVAHAEQAADWGYGLQNRTFTGISLGAGVQLGRKWTIGVAYEKLGTKRGGGRLAWDGSDVLAGSQTHGVLDYRTVYEQSDVLVQVQYQVLMPGLSVMTGKEYSRQTIDFRGKWTRYSGAVQLYETPFRDRRRGWSLGTVFGLCYVHTTGSRFSYQGTVSYSSLWTGGIRVRGGLALDVLGSR